MSDVNSDDDDKKLDPAAERVVAQVRKLMMISGVITLVAVATILGVIGYRVFRSEGSTAAADATALLPKGARIVATAVTEDRVIVTLDIGGQTEVRAFDLKTFRPVGRLRFATEP